MKAVAYKNTKPYCEFCYPKKIKTIRGYYSSNIQARKNL